MTWPVALSAVVVSTRIRGGVDDSEDTSVRHHQVHGMGPLVIYMIAPLLLHTCLYYNSSVDIELKPPRDTLALGITLILGAMASSYHCLLRIENRRLAVRESDTRARLAHQAFHDQLTGLPNRNLFRDRLQVTIEEAARQKGRCAVMFCDLDQFKVINDSLGHEAGDQALKATAKQLQKSVRAQDTAMYQAKLHGSDTYTLFTDAMNEAAQERLAIEQGLRTGLIEDRFSVFYQPIVELGSGRTTMYEALLRWNHPKRGCVAPVNFIDVVKIDRSFVKDLSSGSVSETIVCAVVSMARALDFYVVAEGVETEAELEVVRQSQCDGAQGYLLGAPQPACDV